jgi:hypothetical protein
VVRAVRAGAVAALLLATACAGEMRPLPYTPRGLSEPGSVDGKPIAAVLDSIASGRIPAEHLPHMVKREPQLAKAFASEQLVMRCIGSGQFTAGVYLARTWATLSGATLSAVVSAASSLPSEESALALLSILELECPRNCGLNPSMRAVIDNDWVRVAAWVAEREHARGIWNASDSESGELLLNRARSRAMVDLLIRQGAQERSREELAAYVAEREREDAEIRAEERAYRAEREAREEAEAEMMRLDQQQREAELDADAEASARTSAELWGNINNKLDNLVSETRATNEQIVANTRDAHERAAAQREAAEAERRARESENEARMAELRERQARDAEERAQAAADAAEARARARADAATAATAPRTTVINNPFSGPAVSISQGGMMPSGAGSPSSGATGPSSTSSSPGSQPAGAVAAAVAGGAQADAPAALRQAHPAKALEAGCRVYASLQNGTGTLARFIVCIREMSGGWGQRLTFVFENLSDTRMTGVGHAVYRTTQASGAEKKHSDATMCMSDVLPPGKSCKAQQLDAGKDPFTDVEIAPPIASYAVGEEVIGHSWDFYGQVVVH